MYTFSSMLSRLSARGEPILVSCSSYIKLSFLGFLDSHPTQTSFLARSLSRLTTITMSITPPVSRCSAATVYSGDALPTTTSHVPGDRPESPTRPRVSETSTLWNSLLHVIAHPNAASRDLMETVVTSNNPQPLKYVIPDNADYWVKSTGEALAMRFPAKIDRCGQFSRLGPYFNLPFNGVRPFDTLLLPMLIVISA